MAKRKLTIGGGFIAICEEAILEVKGEMMKALFHPNLENLTECAGYAPYWVCSSWNDYEKVKESN